MGGTSTDVCLVLGGRAGACRPSTRWRAADPAAVARRAHRRRRRRRIARIDAGGALVVGRPERRGRPGPGVLRAGRHRAHRHRRQPRGRSHPGRRRLRMLGMLDLDAAASGPGPGRGHRRGRDRRGRRRDGAGGAARCRWSGGSIPRPGPRGLRRRRPAARLRSRRRARHAGGGRPGRGRGALRGGAARSRRASSSWSAPGPTPPTSATWRRRSRTWPEAAAGWAPTPGRTVSTAVDCRYAGQSHEMRVPAGRGVPGGAPAPQRLRPPGRPVEVIAVRAWPRPGAGHHRRGDLPAGRGAGRGGGRPRGGAEADCTIWVPAGWRASRGRSGRWCCRQAAAAAGPA